MNTNHKSGEQTEDKGNPSTLKERKTSPVVVKSDSQLPDEYVVERLQIDPSFFAFMRKRGFYPLQR